MYFGVIYVASVPIDGRTYNAIRNEQNWTSTRYPSRDAPQIRRTRPGRADGERRGREEVAQWARSGGYRGHGKRYGPRPVQEQSRGERFLVNAFMYLSRSVRYRLCSALLCFALLSSRAPLIQFVADFSSRPRSPSPLRTRDRSVSCFPSSSSPARPSAIRIHLHRVSPPRSRPPDFPDRSARSTDKPRPRRFRAATPCERFFRDYLAREARAGASSAANYRFETPSTNYPRPTVDSRTR